jgi:hypothetical protein
MFFGVSGSIAGGQMIACLSATFLGTNCCMWKIAAS